MQQTRDLGEDTPPRNLRHSRARNSRCLTVMQPYGMAVARLLVQHCLALEAQAQATRQKPILPLYLTPPDSRVSSPVSHLPRECTTLVGMSRYWTNEPRTPGSLFGPSDRWAVAPSEPRDRETTLRHKASFVQVYIYGKSVRCRPRLWATHSYSCSVCPFTIGCVQ